MLNILVLVAWKDPADVTPANAPYVIVCSSEIVSVSTHFVVCVMCFCIQVVYHNNLVSLFSICYRSTVLYIISNVIVKGLPVRSVGFRAKGPS